MSPVLRGAAISSSRHLILGFLRGPSAVKNIHRSLVIGCSMLALSACGPDDIASPGGGNITIINNTGGGGTPTPGPAPTPTPTGSLVTPATGCPTIADPQGLSDFGTITGPTGEWRVCTLPARINVSTKLEKVPGLLYRLGGRVDVGTDGGFFPDNSDGASDTNVTLTIDPGVIVFGGTGVSWLAVNRGNKLNAVGTQTQPIIFTSRDNVLGLNTENSQGQWGGIVLLGRGRTTDCAFGSVAADTCERNTEGASDPAIFGGRDNSYNAGSLKYVQIRYSGYVLSGNSELQSLTPGGSGTGTTYEYIQSHNSSDDGIEFFGGAANMKHIIVTGSDDDSFDVDTGAQVNAQYVILAQREGGGDSILEIDSNGNESDVPRTNLKISNFTFIQRKAGNSNGTSLYFRGNSDIMLMNGILVSPNNPCLGIHNNFTTADFKSVVMQCGTPIYIDTGSAPAGAAAGFFGTGSDNNSDNFSPTLTSLFINGANEGGVPVFNANGVSSYFDTVSYIGAVRDASDTWYAGWTCNSAAANFGSGNSGACTSLPTT